MSSSSDSESDENTKMLLASVDTNFISDKMYKEDTDDQKPSDTAKTAKSNLKSNRYVENVEEVFQSDINVPESMKKYVGKKFSEMVSQQVEFVDVVPEKKSKKRKSDDDIGIQLLKNGPIIDLSKDSLPDLPEMANKPMVIKKRVVEEDTVPESTKVQSAVIDSKILLNGTDTKHWRRRQKPKVFQYKTKNGVLYFREPETEWTKLRNKNNWDESKIKGFRSNNKQA